MNEILTMTYHTTDLSLMSEACIREEIRTQGVEKLIFHITYTDYFVFAVNTLGGRIFEIFKCGGGYFLRDNFDKNHYWQFPDEGNICDLVRGYLEKLAV